MCELTDPSLLILWHSMNFASLTIINKCTGQMLKYNTI